MHKWLYEKPEDPFHTRLKILKQKNFPNCFLLLDIYQKSVQSLKTHFSWCQFSNYRTSELVSTVFFLTDET